MRYVYVQQNRKLHVDVQQAYDYISEASDLADLLSNRPDQIFNLETQFKS